jgi:hypothetical protein
VSAPAVLDTSAQLAWFFAEPGADDAALAARLWRGGRRPGRTISGHLEGSPPARNPARGPMITRGPDGEGAGRPAHDAEHVSQIHASARPRDVLVITRRSSAGVPGAAQGAAQTASWPGALCVCVATTVPSTAMRQVIREFGGTFTRDTCIFGCGV